MSLPECPSREELRAFTFGQLPEPTLEVIAEHLEHCPACEATVGSLERETDTFIVELRHPVDPAGVLLEPEFQDALAGALDAGRGEQGPPHAATQTWGQAPGQSPPEVPVEFSPRSASPEGIAELSGQEPGLVVEIGHYRLLERIGGGGMGTVYRALHVKLDKVVAVKLIRADRTANPEAIARFEREMKSVGRLKHPNIVQALDGGEENGSHYLVMEYIEGCDLKRLLERSQPLSVADACEMVRQAAVGLQHAHENELVHRDIKPSNLMLSDAGEVKLLDLGLARLREDQPADAELTSGHARMGTADYMAPEQASDAHSADVSADVYSLGCTLYELLAGKPPFAGPQYNTPTKKLVGHERDPAPSVRDARPEVPEALAALLGRMLAKAPDQRPATMAEVAKALRQFTAGADLRRLARRSRGDTTVVPGASQPTCETDASVSSGLVDTETPAEPQPVPLLRRMMFGRPKTAAALAATVAVLAAVITIFTDRGELKIKPFDDHVQVSVSQDGREVAIVDTETSSTVTLRSGEYEVKLVGDRNDLTLSKDRITMRRGGREVVEVCQRHQPELSRDEPLRAIAPFDGRKAKEHQQAWAKYIGVPVEMVNTIGMKFVLIPPGEFDMGSTKELVEEETQAHAGDASYAQMLAGESPSRHVHITKPFYMGVFEVTQEEYQRIMGSNPSCHSASGAGKEMIAGKETKRFPVENMSCEDAIEFSRRISELPAEKAAGRKYCLPTEKQWEYVIRCGTKTRWCFGDSAPQLAEYGWFESNSDGVPHPVGQLKANPWGVFDIYGNVWEWCEIGGQDGNGRNRPCSRA